MSYSFADSLRAGYARMHRHLLAQIINSKGYFPHSSPVYNAWRSTFTPPRVFMVWRFKGHGQLYCVFRLSGWWQWEMWRGKYSAVEWNPPRGS